MRARITRWRSFHLPALNRQQSADITFLWENDTNAKQFIVGGCPSAGVRMIYRNQLPPQQMVLGVNILVAIAIGLLASIALLTWLAPSWNYFLAFALGVSVTALGASIVRISRAAAKLLG
jgi:hypothetical protein